MRMVDVMRNIVASPVYRSEVGTAFKLGFPIIQIRNNKIYVKFLLHMEKTNKGTVEYYLPQYDLVIGYPFRYIVSFKNSSFESVDRPSVPVCRLKVDNMVLNSGRIKDLFHLADDILLSYDGFTDGGEGLIADYASQFIQMVESLGLQALYGGAYDSHCCI